MHEALSDVVWFFACRKLRERALANNATDAGGDARLATALAQLAELEHGERRVTDEGSFNAMPFGSISASLDFGEFLDRQRRFLQVTP